MYPLFVISTYLNNELGFIPELFILYFIYLRFVNIKELNVRIYEIVFIVYFLKGFYIDKELLGGCSRGGCPGLNLISLREV